MSRNKKARQFIDAILMKNASKVRQLLNESIQVDIRDNVHQETALMLAAAFAGPEIVQMLIDAGADVNAADNRGQTVLMHALDSKRYENFLLVLDAGANIHSVNVEGCTALMRAVSAVNESAVRELIRRGVDINAKDFAEETALYKAEINGFVHLADLLKAAGAR